MRDIKKPGMSSKALSIPRTTLSRVSRKLKCCFASIRPNLAEKIDLVTDVPGGSVNYTSGHYKNSRFLTNTSPMKYVLLSLV